MGVALYSWMVYLMEIPTISWMIPLGPLHPLLLEARIASKREKAFQQLISRHVGDVNIVLAITHKYCCQFCDFHHHYCYYIIVIIIIIIILVVAILIIIHIILIITTYY